jgi:hypothetical protein
VQRARRRRLERRQHDGARGVGAVVRGGRSGLMDAFRLRVNAYRVLLTRGRDATVVYVPSLPALDETFDHLHVAGFRTLGG